MTPEEKQLLQRVATLTEENTIILRKMRRAAQWASFMKWVYWIFIIFISYGAYIYSKPYLDKFQALYSGINFDAQQMNTIRENLQNLGK